MTPRIPDPLASLAARLLALLSPRAERDEIMADVRAEYDALVVRAGRAAARGWIWRQAVRSLPALIGLRWRREATEFEPNANAYRPGDHMIATLLGDARYALRRLRTRPTYAALAVLTLALGVGGVAAVFGIARGLIFSPLPYANAERVAEFWFDGSWTEREFTSLRGSFPGFEKVAAFRNGDVTMRDNGGPARLVSALTASAELFDVLGVKPFMGRGFQVGDDVQGAPSVAVLSYALWRDMGGDGNVIGSRLVLDGTPRTVVGVMPRGFWYPTPDVRMWLPRPLDPNGQNGSFTLVGLAAPGHDVRAMHAEVTQLTKILGERFTYAAQWDKTKNGHVTPIRDALVGGMRPALVATLVAMGLILLIACANVAALMLGQIEGRATELAVRAALGANKGRLTQQLVMEALVIGVMAATLGAGFAAAGQSAIAHALPIGAWANASRFNATMFAAAFVVAIVAVLIVAVVPTAVLWRDDLRDALSRVRTAGVRGRGGRLERGLVVVEVALAMLIASGAALLARSVSNLYSIDPGIDADGVAVIDALASGDLNNPDRRKAIVAAKLALDTLPGVQFAAGSMRLPLRGNGNSFDISIPERPDLPVSTTFFRLVTRDYFAALGIRVRRGRVFESSDGPDTVAVNIVVNEALVKKYFPNVDPIGRIVGGGFGIPQRIIGVVEDVAEGKLQDEAKPARYYLAGTVPWFAPQASFVIRTKPSVDATAILEQARKTIQQTSPTLAVFETTTMSRVLARAVGPARQLMSLLGILAGLAMVLGAIGIYGVIAHFAARRQRDWAIRVALGLPGSRVVSHIVGQGTTLVLGGVAIGLVGTLALTRLLSTFLYKVSAFDPLAFVVASLALLIVGMAAAFFPARRAGTVDPAIVLREQ